MTLEFKRCLALPIECPVVIPYINLIIELQHVYFRNLYLLCIAWKLEMFQITTIR